MFNPMQLTQMMSTLQASNNPMALMQQMVGNDPLMQRAMQMGQGKTPDQLQQIARNLARQRGISDAQFSQMISQFPQFGLKI